MARTHGHGNPKWARDETILALDLYLQCDSMPSRNDPRVQELSELLRRLPFYAVGAENESFRNADGVAFKLQNIRQVATGKGLGNVSETDRQVWAELGEHPDQVRQLAASIRAGAGFAASTETELDDSSAEEFFEGRILTQLHKRRERDPRIRKRLLTSRRRNGTLRCENCNFQARCIDPMLEDADFEAHHLLALATMNERNTRLRDMALLCANCHRLIHRASAITRRWIGIDEGRDLLARADS
jgi:5-methylcytosine-specific restriction protein A